jgi:hypothetical protein
MLGKCFVMVRMAWIILILTKICSSVGHFDYSGNLDTCIAIRTMVFKDGIAYLQGKLKMQFIF